MFLIKISFLFNQRDEQNFEGVRAYATTLQGTTFLGDEEAISKGIEPHHDDANTVYVGRVENEEDGNINLKKAVNISFPTKKHSTVS